MIAVGTAAASARHRVIGFITNRFCSVLPEENEAIAQTFGAAHPEFVPLDAGELLAQLKVEQAASLCSGGETGTAYLRMWPHRHQTDGFFAAVWTRKG